MRGLACAATGRERRHLVIATMRNRRLVLLALFALGEAAIISPVVLFCVPLPMLDRPGVIGLVFVLLMGLAALWRWLGNREVPERAQMLSLGAVLLALTVIGGLQLAGLRREFELTLIWLLPGFLAALLVLWRGASLGQTELTFTDASRRLQMGALALVVLGMLAVFLPNNRLIDSIVPFFVSAALALPLAHLESVSLSIYGRAVPMTRGWWGWSALITGVAALASVLLLSLVTDTPIAFILLGLIALIALPFVLLLSLLLPGLLSARFPAFSLRLPSAPSGPQGEALNGVFDSLTVSPQANFVIAVIILAVIGGAVLLLMGVAQRSRSEAGRVRERADFDVVIPVEPADALHQLRGSLNLRRWLAALTVRRLYARMVHEAGKRGHKRLPAQTPLDYLPQLNRAFPNCASELGALTDAYVAAHYGELPDSDAALAQLRAAWERTRARKPSPLSTA